MHGIIERFTGAWTYQNIKNVGYDGKLSFKRDKPK